jgi:signal transduction histidine kinase/CheY-like chemotaxis protein
MKELDSKVETRRVLRLIRGGAWSCALVLAVVCLRSLLEDYPGLRETFLTYAGAVFGATFLAGWSGALCASFLSGVSAAFDHPDVLAALVSFESIAAMLLLFLSGVALLLLCEIVITAGRWSWQGTALSSGAFDRIEASHLLEQKQGELNQLLHERDDLLAAERSARTESERLNRGKDEFLATLSHELRTPLNAIYGWAQLLEVKKFDQQFMEEGLATIRRNAKAQSQLIDDLLDVSRFVSGRLHLNSQMVYLSGVVEEAIDSVRSSLDGRSLRLEQFVETDPHPMLGDPARLHQIVWNILSNSIKFTPANGVISVTLRLVEGWSELTVSDTGKGIRPEMLPHIFDRFNQTDYSSVKAHGGLGLGMALAKQLTELHGGSITAESQGEGKGSTFRVRLPRTLSSESPPAPDRRAGPRSTGVGILSGIKVLLVDDDAESRMITTRILSDSRAEVFVASSAAEAFSIFRRERPDVILSDISMPDYNGYELMRWVRSLGVSEGGETPAAALSGFARTEDREKAQRAGYQRFLSKPLEAGELILAISMLAHAPDSRQALH